MPTICFNWMTSTYTLISFCVLKLAYLVKTNFLYDVISYDHFSKIVNLFSMLANWTGFVLEAVSCNCVKSWWTRLVWFEHVFNLEVSFHVEKLFYCKMNGRNFGIIIFIRLFKCHSTYRDNGFASSDVFH